MPYWESIQQAKSNLAHMTASAIGHEYQRVRSVPYQSSKSLCIASKDATSALQLFDTRNLIPPSPSLTTFLPPFLFIYQGEDYTRGHFPLNGFSDGKVVSDARFRLASALRQVCAELNYQHNGYFHLAVFLPPSFLISKTDIFTPFRLEFSTLMQRDMRWQLCTLGLISLFMGYCNVFNITCIIMY